MEWIYHHQDMLLFFEKISQRIGIRFPNGKIPESLRFPYGKFPCWNRNTNRNTNCECQISRTDLFSFIVELSTQNIATLFSSCIRLSLMIWGNNARVTPLTTRDVSKNLARFTDSRFGGSFYPRLHSRWITLALFACEKKIHVWIEPCNLAAYTSFTSASQRFLRGSWFFSSSKIAWSSWQTLLPYRSTFLTLKYLNWKYIGACSKNSLKR